MTQPKLVRRPGPPREDAEQRPIDFGIVRRLFAFTKPYARKRNGLVAMVVLRAMQFPALGWSTAALLSGPIAARDAHGTWLGVAGLLALIASTPPSELAWKSAERWFTPPFLASGRPLVEREVAIVSGVSHAPYAASYAVLVENDLVDEVHAIGNPTLIITGELDEGSTPAMSTALHQRIRGSRLVIVPGVKHYIHIEQPKTLALEINGWLATIDPVAAAGLQAASGH